MAISRPQISTVAENETRAIGFWSRVDERIHSIIASMFGQPRYRVMALNIPLAGRTTPVAGYLQSVGVTFNCRIVGYKIIANVAGTITIDIWRSRTIADPGPGEIAHPTAEQMPGVALPSLNGFDVEVFDFSSWAITELLDGDTLHFYIISALLLREAVLVLRLQELDRAL